MVESDLIDCMIALPDRLFYSTSISACLWFLSKDKGNRQFRDRRKDVLFIDARSMGLLADRIHRELTNNEIQYIVKTYHSWRGEKNAGEYKDIPGYCKNVHINKIIENNYILAPGHYVGNKQLADDIEQYDHKIGRLINELEDLFTESIV